MNNKENNPFKKGKNVHDLELNDGKVISVDDQSKYPIGVRFKSGEKEVYTYEGKRYENGNQMLFLQEMKVVPK